MPPLAIADFAVLVITAVAAILGAFGGFSGALGFGAGLIAAGLAVRFGRGCIAEFLPAGWMVAIGVLVLALVCFGLVRVIVKRVVKGLLAQPADAIFGALVAAVSGAAVSLAALSAARTFLNLEFDSELCTLVLQLVHA